MSLKLVGGGFSRMRFKADETRSNNWNLDLTGQGWYDGRVA